MINCGNIIQRDFFIMANAISNKFKMGLIGLFCISTVGCQNMTAEDWGMAGIGALVVGAVAVAALSDRDNDDDDDDDHHRDNHHRHHDDERREDANRRLDDRNQRRNDMNDRLNDRYKNKRK